MFVYWSGQAVIEVHSEDCLHHHVHGEDCLECQLLHHDVHGDDCPECQHKHSGSPTISVA